MIARRTTLFLLLQVVLGLFLILVFSSAVFPFTTDSLIHISTAQRVVSFKGLTFTNFFVLPPEPNYLPTSLAPPGYPLLIALFKLFGIDEYTASVLLPRLCFLMLPYLFFIIYKKIMPVAVAMAASFVCTFMFSIVKCSLIAWTDVPFLFFSLICLAMVFQMIEKKGKVSAVFVFILGVLAGYSYLIRFVGGTLILSIMAGMVLCVLLELISLKDFIKKALVCSIGIALVIVPYSIRNLIVLGSIKPFNGVPQLRAGLLYTIHVYFRELAEMVFINRSFDILVFVLMAGLGMCFLRHAQGLLNRHREQFIYFFILSFYFIINSILLIDFKTKYTHAEGINDRYLIQIAWVFAAGLVLGLYKILKNIKELKPVSFNLIAGLLVFIFALFQVYPAKVFYEDQKGMTALSQKIEQYVPLLRSLPKDYVIVSNVADLTYFQVRRNVRMLSNYTPYGLRYFLGTKRRFAVFLVREVPSLWMHGPDWRVPRGYYRGFSDKNIDLLLALDKI